MAKTKAELLEEAKALNLEVTEANTVAEITEAIKGVETPEGESSEEKEVKTAKAGKRSAKAIAEAEKEAARQARKESGDTTPQDEDAEAAVKKGPKPVTRPKIERRGKGYRKVAEQIEKNKAYSVAE